MYEMTFLGDCDDLVRIFIKNIDYIGWSFIDYAIEIDDKMISQLL